MISIRNVFKNKYKYFSFGQRPIHSFVNVFNYKYRKVWKYFKCKNKYFSNEKNNFLFLNSEGNIASHQSINYVLHQLINELYWLHLGNTRFSASSGRLFICALLINQSRQYGGHPIVLYYYSITVCDYYINVQLG